MSNEEKLVKMLKYVAEHNDFYKNRIKEYGIKDPLDITQWPVLTRKELQENRYNMFSDGYKSKYFNQQLRRQSSSGSTGMPVNVYWDYKDWYASNMSLWRKRQEWYGIKPSDKYCIFTLNAFGITPEDGKLFYINEPRNFLSFNVSLIHDERGYEQMAKIINGFKPDWLFIQPFVLNQLIRAYKNLNLEPAKTIRYIESVGEVLTSDLRRIAEEFFNVVVTNMYGTEEMNGIALENPTGEMRVLNKNVLLEIKKDKSVLAYGEGSALITNLNNYAMPLVRYEIRDHVKIRYQHCINGEEGTVIDCICGRENRMISLGGRNITESFLAEIIAETNNSYRDPIKDYSFHFNRNTNELYCILCLHHYESNLERIIYHIKGLFQSKLEHHTPIKFVVYPLKSTPNNNAKKQVLIIE